MNLINFYKKKVLRPIQVWNMPKDEDFNFELISYYFLNKNDSNTFQNISDRVIEDIDFCELFRFMDRTNSKIGQQYLFDKLLTINNHIYFDRQEKWIDYFQNNEEQRREIQISISNLNDRKTYHISNLFLDEYLKRPKWFWMIKILSILPVLLLIISYLYKNAFILLLVSIIVNIAVHYWNKKHIFLYTDSIPQLLRLCRTIKDLLKLDPFIQSNAGVFTSLKSIKKLKTKMSVFVMEARNESDISALLFLIVEYIKILFLLEPLIVFNVLNKLDNKRKDIQNLYEYIGEIDSALSIAAIRDSVEIYCIPTIALQRRKTLEFKNIYHPLIPNCVPNSLQINTKSILLTGSNMSGKTTFIRTVAINLLLAQTINTCFAKDFEYSQTRLFSAIRITDDLLNDKSYYFEEVATIKNMIDESQYSCNNLFLLDEIFKGTNTTERIAAGKAVLSYLAKQENNLVFVSTHDIELTDLLNDEYELYHFTEVIQEGKIHFDYKLKAGNLSTKNAIRILELNNYPQEVIQEARKISKKLS
jgi:hypothetical protein